MSVTINLTTQQFQSLVSNHPAALAELGLLPQPQPQAQAQAQAQPQAQPQAPDFTQFIDLMVDIFDGPPEDLERLRQHITSALKGKKVEKKWDLEFESAPQGTPVGGPEPTLEPLTTPQEASCPALPDSPQAVSRKTLSQAHLNRMKAGRTMKRMRLGYRLATDAERAAIVSKIDAGELVSPLPSVSWRKGQPHHPNNPSVKNVIGVMATCGDLSEVEITAKSKLKARRVRDILRELERQGIARAF